MSYKSNTFQTQASLNPCLDSVDDRIPKHPECTIDIPPPICLKWFGSAEGQAQSAGVRAAGESATHLCHFLTLPAVFHASDVQSA